MTAASSARACPTTAALLKCSEVPLKCAGKFSRTRAKEGRPLRRRPIVVRSCGGYATGRR
jgi:hypothetical protein